MLGASNYTHISTNSAGAAISNAPCTLHYVNVNTKGASSNVLTLYDGTSTGGAVIGVFDTTNAPGGWEIFCQCKVGLFYVLAAGTAADLTIVWG